MCIRVFPNPESYTKPINTSIDKTSKYVYFIDSEHPLSNKSGKVYYHRHVYSIKIGKWISKEYHVHHKDGNRCNNNPCNLEAIVARFHGRKHAIQSGYTVRKVSICLCCKQRFVSIGGCIFCSCSCSSSFRNKGLKSKISKEELEKLVWEKPTTEIAQDFNCSDVAISKLCKKYGINKPPRGYWSKIDADKKKSRFES